MLILLAVVDGGTVVASELEARQNEVLANHLAFYFNSGTRILPKDLLETYLQDPDNPTARIFRRILAKREEKARLASHLNKKMAEDGGATVSFSAQEIREATLEEFVSLGEDATPVFVKMIHSAREDIRLWVIRSLNTKTQAQLLKVYSEILLRDRDGRAEFSVHCRVEAASVLWRYLDDERGRSLFRIAIRDKDFEIRNATFVAPGKMSDEASDFFVQEIVSLLAREHETSRRAFKEWSERMNEVIRLEEQRAGLQDENAIRGKYPKKVDFYAEHPELLMPLARILEVVAEFSPKSLADLNFDLDLMLQPCIGKVLMLHSDDLATSVRVNVLMHFLLEERDRSVQIQAMKALREGDKLTFSPLIIRIVRESRDTSVLLEALEIVRRWGIKEAVSTLEEMAVNDYRKSVRDVAKKTVESL
ncbi:MAG: hypothetical protein HQL31_00355 [Planctomycetes bacterium]|nr:hypothetical protein [Planctomycetota bacterium]